MWGVIEGDRFWVVSSPGFLRNPLAPILDCRCEMTEHGVLLHARLGRLRIARAAIAAWTGIWMLQAILAEVTGAWGESEPFGQLVPSSYVHIVRPLLLSTVVSALMVLFAALVSRLQRPRLVSQLKQVLGIVSEHEIL